LNKGAIAELFERSRRVFGWKQAIGERCPNPEGVFAHQELFEALLCRERKRAERSGQSLILMLVRAIDPRDAGLDELMTRAAHLASRAIRDTDIAGWYQQGTALGILFTELGTASAEQAAKAIEDKVVGALREALKDFSRLQISVYFFPEEFDGQNRDPGFSLTLYPDYEKRMSKKRTLLVIKRMIDIAGSAILMVLTAPVLLLIAIAVKCSSPGPVLFSQERVGQLGVPFRFLKFRSMRVATDPGIHEQFVRTFIAGKNEGQATGSKRVFKITQDPRVTRVGRFLRRTSLDELPQFWNVFCGEMSLVGPRPPIRYELDAYQLWHRRRLLEAKPGITGLWQVHGRSRTTFDEMVRLDLDYARSWSLLLDFQILLRTPRAVVSGEGAY
jgi:lipopolysaccharide/colanic/teichoic acid biosynthesis glycosyltransferase